MILDLLGKMHDISGGFQLSPDFRQRASSNASSCGRLSPIPAVLGIEPDWGYPQDDFAPTTTTSTTAATTTAQQQGSAQLDQLAGSLADDLTLQSEFMQGSVFHIKTTYNTLRNHLFCHFLSRHFSPLSLHMLS